MCWCALDCLAREVWCSQGALKDFTCLEYSKLIAFPYSVRVIGQESEGGLFLNRPQGRNPTTKVS